MDNLLGLNRTVNGSDVVGDHNIINSKLVNSNAQLDIQIRHHY